MKTTIARLSAIFMPLVLATGCATVKHNGTLPLSKQVSMNDRIAVMQKGDQFSFCPIARLKDEVCNLTGRTYFGQIVSGWMSPTDFTEAVLNRPLDMAPKVTDVPAGSITIRYLERGSPVWRVLRIRGS